MTGGDGDGGEAAYVAEQVDSFIAGGEAAPASTDDWSEFETPAADDGEPALPTAAENARGSLAWLAEELGMSADDLPDLATVERLDARVAGALKEAFGDEAGQMVGVVQSELMRFAKMDGGQDWLDQAERLGLHRDPDLLAALADRAMRRHRHHSGNGGTKMTAPSGTDQARLKAKHAEAIRKSVDAYSKMDRAEAQRWGTIAASIAERLHPDGESADINTRLHRR